jgi:hypothetical protein
MKNKISYLIATAAVAGLAQVASAVPSSPGLYLIDTATGDTQYEAIVGGSAAFIGSLGDYSVNINVSGYTVAGGSSPVLDLNIGEAFAGIGASTLQVFYSDGTFGPTTGGGYILATTGPDVVIGHSSVSTSAYEAASAFGETTSLGTTADPGSLTGSLTGNSYYLTLADTITGTVFSVDTSLTSVPDGGTTAMLLGAGLSGLALLKRKLVA